VSSVRQGQNFKYYSCKLSGNAITMPYREKTIASYSNVSRISLQGALRENKKIRVGYIVFQN